MLSLWLIKLQKQLVELVAGNNRFHNFEQAKQEYTAKELEDKLRMKAGGNIGARANS